MVLRDGETLYSYYSIVGSVNKRSTICAFEEVIKKRCKELLDQSCRPGEKMDVVIFLCYPFDVETKEFDMSRTYSVVLVGEKYEAFEKCESSSSAGGGVAKIVAETDCFDPETRTYKYTNMKKIWAYSEKSVNDYITDVYSKDKTARFYDNRHTFMDAVKLKILGTYDEKKEEENEIPTTGRILRYRSTEYHLSPRGRHFFTKSDRVTNEYVVFGEAYNLNPVRNDGVSCSEFIKRINIVTYDIETANVTAKQTKCKDFIHCIGLCVQRDRTPIDIVCITTAKIGEKSCPFVDCRGPVSGRGYDWKFSDLRGFFDDDVNNENNKEEMNEEERSMMIVNNRPAEEDDIGEEEEEGEGGYLEEEEEEKRSVITGIREKNLEEAKKYFEETELNDDDEINNNKFPVTRVVRCSTEYELLKAFFAELKRFDTHVLVGFNNLGFDMKFILRACNYYGIDGVNEMSVHIPLNVYIQDCDSLRNPIRRLDPERKGGLISQKTLELTQNHASGMFEADIYGCHRSKLDDAAKNCLDLETAKLSIGYDNIPVLLYSEDPTLLQYYCLRDTILTAALLNKNDRFKCVDFNYVKEEVSGTSVSQNFTDKKSLQSSAETYMLFRHGNMVQRAAIKPAQMYFRLTFFDVIDYFCAVLPRKKDTYTDLCLSMIYSRECGLWRTRHMESWLKTESKRKNDDDAWTMTKAAKDVLKRICEVIKSGKRGEKQFTSECLMLLVDHVTRDKRSTRPPLRSYRRLIPEVLKDLTEKNANDVFTEMNEFVSFLCAVTVTEFDDLPNDVVPLFVKQKMGVNKKVGRPPVLAVESLARALSGNMKEIKVIRDEFLALNLADRVRNSDLLARTLWNDVIEKSGVNVFLEQSKYDGAHLVEPIVGLYDKHSVAVKDMTGFYPGCMMETNTGLSTEISYDKAANLIERGVLREGIDFHCINVRRVDDGVDWKRYASAYPDYVKRNYVFFLSKEMCESVYACQLKKGVALRNVHKYKAQDQSLSEQERREHLSKSDTLKIGNNAYYGLFKRQAPTIRQSAVVTSRARGCIKKTIEWCVRELGLHVVYGDTDSIMTRLSATDDEIVEAILNEDATGKSEKLLHAELLGIDLNRLREECRKAIATGKGDLFVGSYIATIVSKVACEYLNVNNLTYNKPNNLEHEKVNRPFMLHTKKSYIGWKPLEGRYLKKGEFKTYMRITLDICSKIMDYVRDGCPEKIYPYIVETLVRPCIDGTIDTGLICKHQRIDVESKTLSDKWVSVVASLKESGQPILFPKQHFAFVYVREGDKQVYATVDQFENAKMKRDESLRLDVQETLEQALAIPLKRLGVMYDEETFDYFRRLQIPLFVDDPPVDWSKYKEPCKGKPPRIKISKLARKRLLLDEKEEETKKKKKKKKRISEVTIIRYPRRRKTKAVIKPNRKLDEYFVTVPLKEKVEEKISECPKKRKRVEEEEGSSNKHITDFFTYSVEKAKKREIESWDKDIEEEEKTTIRRITDFFALSK